MTALPRTVTPEALDVLGPGEPAAQRARRDLQRVHRAMGTRSIVLRALRGMAGLREHAAPLRVLELGAGDGSLMLGVAQALAREWPRVELVLLDRQPLVEPATVDAYAALGWQATTQVRDVLDWAAPAAPGRPAGAPRWDLIVANLFVHHFEGAPLAALLGAVAARTDRFLACEPRRTRVALAASHLVGVLGANAVTRGDAVASVHAGFRATEITAAWLPLRGDWRLKERPAGAFSHLFVAERIEAR